MPRRGSSVTVTQADGVQAPMKGIVQIMKACLQRMRPSQPLLLSLILCGTRRIKLLNRRYRHQDKPTDVLSFFYSQPAGEIYESNGSNASNESMPVTGEIYICVPVARRQAKKYHHALTDELRLLAVHGYLHILGHDHATARQAKHMRTLENTLLRKAISRSSHR